MVLAIDQGFIVGTGSAFPRVSVRVSLKTALGFPRVSVRVSLKTALGFPRVSVRVP
jgi:hypothetical protein